MVEKYPYIMCVHVGPSQSGKTEIWEVRAFIGDGLLGYVKWHGAWRKYCLFVEGSIWDAGCLREVLLFIDKVNIEHLKARVWAV